MGGETIKCLSWYSPVPQHQDPEMNRIPVYVTGNTDELHTAHEKKLNEGTAWSFSAAARGEWPCRGPLASQLDARRQAKAGSQLADGIRLVYAGGTGGGKA